MMFRFERRFALGSLSSRLAAGAALLGLGAAACANEPPTASADGDVGRTQAVVTIDRTDPASLDALGSASAVARFISVPAYLDPSRVLIAAGATLDLPPFDGCSSSDSPDELAPPLASQDPVEFVEAGDVAIHAADSVSSLVPHAFPTVGSFASGVLYTTKDREASALPTGVPYLVSASGSTSVSALHLTADAPPSPSDIQVAGVALRDVTEVKTSSPLELKWAAGEPSDVVYVELLAYDGSPSILCTFRDETGQGTISADTFNGAGNGRLALHRVRSRHVDGGASPSGDIRFDFQVGASVEFAK
ncbi:MAG TPA: hypothetical protein VH142_10880 [Polyangiaceae bacterium]|jgi:hypothetical protein|nr:hypothetical protein [Polyangiaceae bacterium]